MTATYISKMQQLEAEYESMDNRIDHFRLTLEWNTFAELKKIAGERNLGVPGRSKKDYIAAIVDDQAYALGFDRLADQIAQLQEKIDAELKQVEQQNETRSILISSYRHNTEEYPFWKFCQIIESYHGKIISFDGEVITVQWQHTMNRHHFELANIREYA